MSPMALTSRVVWVLRISFLSVVLFSISFYILQPQEKIRHYYDNYHEASRVPENDAKSAFIKGVVEAEIDGPFDSGTLRSLCDGEKWTEGLIFKCEAPKGGLAVVRNVFLNCVRFAIEAGATSFIIPEMIGHGSTSTPDEETTKPFEHYFDLEHFKSSLATACPQMSLISHVHELWDKPSVAKPIVIEPYQITPAVAEDKVIAEPKLWHDLFKKYLNETHPKPFSAEKPVLVSLVPPFLQFPLYHDDPHLVANFGKLLRFRADVRKLAGVVLYALDTRHNLGIEAEKEGVRLGHFYGAHLRTEKDAQAAKWTSYEVQSEKYLAHARQSQLGVIYLATGNREDETRMSEVAGNLRIAVTTRNILLAEPGFEKDLAEMQTLSWDQQELIDYEVLLRPAAFGGTHESTFAWNIAMRRHVVAGQGLWTLATNEGSAKEKIDENVDSAPQKRDHAGPGDEVPGKSNQGDNTDLGDIIDDDKRLDGLSSVPEGALEDIDKVLAQSFLDSMSTIYGPTSEGAAIRLAMWP